MVYRVLRMVFSVYLRLFHGLSIKGRGNIPDRGPVILCANHSSYFDSMLLAVCCTRPVRFMISHAFYQHPLLGWFVKQCGSIPVTHSGRDKEAMSCAIAFLRGGGVLGIFPEGGLTLSGIPGRGKSGAALLAVATGAVVVPITIAGAFSVYPKGRKRPGPGNIAVNVHRPVTFDEGQRKNKEYLQAMTDAFMARIGRRLVAHGRRVKLRQKNMV